MIGFAAGVGIDPDVGRDLKIAKRWKRHQVKGVRDGRDEVSILRI